MDKLRLGLQSLFITLAMMAGYELKLATSWDTPVRILAITVVGFILSNLLADHATRLLLSYAWVRKKAFGRAWVEGHWYIETYDPSKDQPVARGLLTFSYADDGSLVAAGYKLQSPESELETVSRSRFAVVNSADLFYMNHFVYTLGTKFIHGIALGNFHQDENGFPVRYDGKLHFFNEMPERRQIALKMKPAEVKRLRKAHGETWRTHYLQSRS